MRRMRAENLEEKTCLRENCDGYLKFANGLKADYICEECGELVVLEKGGGSTGGGPIGRAERPSGGRNL